MNTSAPSPPAKSAASTPPSRPPRGLARRVLRAAGWLFLAAAAAALVADIAKATTTGKLELAPLGQIWADLHRNSLLLFQPAIERYLTPWLWRSIVQPILETPGIIVLSVPAIALLFISRRRRATRGH